MKELGGRLLGRWVPGETRLRCAVSGMNVRELAASRCRRELRTACVTSNRCASYETVHRYERRCPNTRCDPTTDSTSSGRVAGTVTGDFVVGLRRTDDALKHRLAVSTNVNAGRNRPRSWAVGVRKSWRVVTADEPVDSGDPDAGRDL